MPEFRESIRNIWGLGGEQESDGTCGETLELSERLSELAEEALEFARAGAGIEHCCALGHGQQPSKPASNLLPPVQPAPSTSSLPPVLASTLAPIAEAEEPNNDKAAQSKEDESKMDCATTVAITVNQSTIADDSALISDPIAIVTNSGIFSRSTTKSVAHTRPAASITDLAIATGLAASNESTVPTSVETILASPIAATEHLMDVDMTGPAPPHPPDEIVPMKWPQCLPSHITPH
ncbi:hypothetical protein C0989_007095 [Termitomyces sp. Mn162]|nr:hypothetical protein C0989_007095 [Termitomyces sp. Mn162]